MSGKTRSENIAIKSHAARKAGLFLVAALILLTLAGHMLTRATNASPSFAGPSLQSSDSLVTLAGRVDRTTVLAGGPGHVKMELSLRAAERTEEIRRTPVDMWVVLDRSGSMGGEKIEAAKAAIATLIEQLLPGDRLALIAFSSGAEILIPLQETSPVARAAWQRTVDAISAGGGTNMSAGLDLALSLAEDPDLSATPRPMGRLLLLSDGAANEGDPTPEGLRQRALRASRLEYVLSSIGVGEGFNEFLMTALADAGTGNFYYLEETMVLAEVFSNELGATRETVARGLAVTLEPPPGVEVVDAAGYPLETTGEGVTFRPGTLFAGQERRVWVTLRVPTQRAGETSLGSVRATYATDGEARSIELPEPPRIACVSDRTRWLAGIDREAWSRSVVEEDYSRLRQSVASHVQAGRREEALREIASYEKENRLLNQDLGSDDVEANLEETKKLEAEVKDAFEGRMNERRMKQNALSKKQQATSWDDRRAGSKRLPSAKKVLQKGEGGTR